MLRIRIVLTALIFICVSSNVFGHDGETEEQILKSIFRNYNRDVRPPTRGPIEVIVNVFLRSVDPIDDINREFSIQVTLRQEWKDERLKFSPPKDVLIKYLTQQSPNKLWIPDLSIQNEKSGQLHDIVNPNRFVRIFPDGNILYSIRISSTMICGLQLQNFPFDMQNCTMQLASYGMTTDDIRFKWKNIDPVQVSPNVNATLPLFSLQKWETETCYTKTITGLYSCLRLDLHFKRHFSHYLIQVYIPCTSLVILAWLSFWMEYGQPFPRIYLTLTTYLILIVATIILNLNLPSTSYTKAIDTWTGTCLTFVSGTFFQTIVLYFFGTSSSEVKNVASKKRNFAEKLDIISRALYPALFALFVGIYFRIYWK